ncbi:hypothetical protein OUZ56_033654 [Daphnia magna]|uniref:Uncharacterized protein n=1 Tax=Daphnia magna TaxID=35525 RepID=A0ABQ9ZY43_9CRUS|nr:hypothetical protein OUZ56_033654 [Daphnia magna]
MLGDYLIKMGIVGLGFHGDAFTVSGGKSTTEETTDPAKPKLPTDVMQAVIIKASVSAKLLLEHPAKRIAVQLHTPEQI